MVHSTSSKRRRAARRSRRWCARFASSTVHQLVGPLMQHLSHQVGSRSSVVAKPPSAAALEEQDPEPDGRSSERAVPDDLVRQREVPLGQRPPFARGDEAEDDLCCQPRGGDAHRDPVQHRRVQAHGLLQRTGCEQRQGAGPGEERRGGEGAVAVPVIPAARIAAATVEVVVVELAEDHGRSQAGERQHASELVELEHVPACSQFPVELLLPRHRGRIRGSRRRKQIDVWRRRASGGGLHRERQRRGQGDHLAASNRRSPEMVARSSILMNSSCGRSTLKASRLSGNAKVARTPPPAGWSFTATSWACFSPFSSTVPCSVVSSGCWSGTVTPDIVPFTSAYGCDCSCVASRMCSSRFEFPLSKVATRTRTWTLTVPSGWASARWLLPFAPPRAATSVSSCAAGSTRA